jgi:hypothetical protein
MSVDVVSLDEQVRKLIAAHSKQTRNGRLLFAGWYDKNNLEGNVSLFEVYEDFPDPGCGKLETFVFPSTADFPISGKLKLTITSPSELHDAIAGDDITLGQILRMHEKEVIYPSGADWSDIFRDFGQ